jgi:hypothetical protein
MLLGWNSYFNGFHDDKPVLVFLGPITPIFLYNFPFFGLDIFTLKMDAVFPSEKLVNISSVTLHINPED